MLCVSEQEVDKREDVDNSQMSIKGQAKAMLPSATQISKQHLTPFIDRNLVVEVLINIQTSHFFNATKIRHLWHLKIIFFPAQVSKGVFTQAVKQHILPLTQAVEVKQHIFLNFHTIQMVPLKSYINFMQQFHNTW